MRVLRAVLVRFADLFSKTRRDRELTAEIDSHLQMQIDDNVRAGMTPDEARRQAFVRFGGVEAVKEAYRDRRGLPFVETTVQDARYALRALRRNPGIALVGVLVMALAIGANTAVFSVVHAVILNPLPYDDPDRIVTLTYVTRDSETLTKLSRQVSAPDFQDWLAQSTGFDGMAYYATGRGSVMAGPVAEYTMVTRVSGDFFRVFGKRPRTGRTFAAEEMRQGAAGAAILSDRYARQQFGDPTRAIGRTLRFANRSVPVIGVMPPSFDYPIDTEIWFPQDVFGVRGNRRANNFRALARIKQDVTLEQAQTEMTAISARLEREYPDTNTGVRVVVTPLQREMVGDVAPMLYVLLGAVGVVLLVACATMATLLLARATARAPEMAIRAALGASRSRVVRQLLVESSVQALMAGTVGLLIAVWGTRMLVGLAPEGVPRLDEVSVSFQVLAYTFGLCAIVSVLFGLPPALQAARVDVTDPLRQGTGRVVGGRGARLREALVVVEIALAVVLVAAGALLVRSLIALQQAPLGFRPDRVLMMDATVPVPGGDFSRSRAFFEGLLDDLAPVPGVVAVGAAMAPPGHVETESGYWIDRLPPKESRLSTAQPAVMNVIAPGTFATLGVPIQRGRDFTSGDREKAPLVAIVNESLARAAFGGADPIGRVIFAGYDSDDPMTIVGVVGDVRQYGPAREPNPELYMPYRQHFYNGATLRVLVRTSGDPSMLAATMDRKARDRAPEASVRVRTLDTLLAEHIATPRFRAWLLTLFAIVALCLAMAGVYGVMAYVVEQRSKEIGVRMALGASAGGVVWLMLRRGLKLTAVGLAIGVVAALASTRLLGEMLFGVKPADAATYAGVTTALGILSLLATYIPARWSARIDPLVVLRQE